MINPNSYELVWIEYAWMHSLFKEKPFVSEMLQLASTLENPMYIGYNFFPLAKSKNMPKLPMSYLIIRLLYIYIESHAELNIFPPFQNLSIVILINLREIFTLLLLYFCIVNNHFTTETNFEYIKGKIYLYIWSQCYMHQTVLFTSL